MYLKLRGQEATKMECRKLTRKVQRDRGQLSAEVNSHTCGRFGASYIIASRTAVLLENEASKKSGRLLPSSVAIAFGQKPPTPVDWSSTTAATTGRIPVDLSRDNVVSCQSTTVPSPSATSFNIHLSVCTYLPTRLQHLAGRRNMMLASEKPH